MTEFNRLPTPQELKRLFPMTGKQKNKIENSRLEIDSILSRKDPRMLLVVGPCSIHDTLSAKEYAIRLKTLAEAVSDTFLIVMRVYFEKPRSSIGWKGFLYDPDLDSSGNLAKGLILTRQLLLDITQLGIPIAAEFLDPLAVPYFEELISWGCIGARTSASQIHRQMASALNMPVGFKNNTEGNVDIALQAMLTCQKSHSFFGMSDNGNVIWKKSRGNDRSLLVLRGGEQKPNYDPATLSEISQKLEKQGLPVRFMVDCSHDNCEKKHEKQRFVFQSCIHQIIEGNPHLMGLMLESHLFEGNQTIESSPASLKYGISLTDPCIGWELTESLVLWARDKIKTVLLEPTESIYLSQE